MDSGTNLARNVGHLLRRLKTPSRLLGHHLGENAGEFLGNVFSKIADWFGLAHLLPDHFLMDRSVLKWTLADKQVIEGAAQAVDVGPDVDAVVDGLFGGEIVGGADDVAFFELLDEGPAVVVEEASQPHVEYLDRSLTIEQQIAGLDVAMDEPGLARMFQTESGLANEVHCSGDREGAVAFDEFVKVAAVDKFEDEEMQLAFVIDVVGPDDVGMIQPGNGPSFAIETSHRCRIFGLGHRQHLERDPAAHEYVFTKINLAHAAGPKAIEQPILAADEKATPSAG